MAYSTHATRWRAYQFLDPFAAGSFVVCNKNNNTFCRPDCDAHPNTELQLEVKFLDTPAEAVKLGYTACDVCDPSSAPKIDVNVLAQAVDAINASIGFFPPLRNEDTGYYSETSSPSNKDEADHYRLVDLACRHLVIAAAQSVLSAEATDSEGKKSRRRRGGVLGFKELAAKSKLSAWHFHRVFKNVTCLTPKTYGSKCVEYLTQHRDQSQSPSLLSSANPSSTSLKSYATPMLSTASLSLPRKRSRDESDVGAEPYKRASYETIFTPRASPVMGGYQKNVSFDLPELGWAAPQTNEYSQPPNTLFTHAKPMAEEYSPELVSFDTMAPQMPMMAIEPTMPLSESYLDAFDPNSFLQNTTEQAEVPEMWQLDPVLIDPFTWNLSQEAFASNFV